VKLLNALVRAARAVYI